MISFAVDSVALSIVTIVVKPSSPAVTVHVHVFTIASHAPSPVYNPVLM